MEQYWFGKKKEQRLRKSEMNVTYKTWLHPMIQSSKEPEEMVFEYGESNSETSTQQPKKADTQNTYIKSSH